MARESVLHSAAIDFLHGYQYEALFYVFLWAPLFPGVSVFFGVIFIFS